jgi:hypothetical protein
MVPTTEHAREGMQAALWSRSQESRDFEALWNRMRGGALVPPRSSFNVAKAARFVRDLVLMEAPAPERRTIRIRLAGERYQEIAGCNLAGRDHLEHFDADYRDGALTTGWLMANHPCGLWQITPMHTAKGYGQYIEVTGFPLGAGEDGIPLLLCHVRLTGRLLHTRDNRFGMDTASDFHFIDVGAGVPVWAD